jgi:hypothetical protein
MGDDSSQGNFHKHLAAATSIEIPYYKNSAFLGDSILTLESFERDDPRHSLLNTRAWATQEWILSRRMVHCIRGGLAWVCKYFDVHGIDNSDQISNFGLLRNPWD